MLLGQLFYMETNTVPCRAIVCLRKSSVSAPKNWLAFVLAKLSWVSLANGSHFDSDCLGSGCPRCQWLIDLTVPKNKPGNKPVRQEQSLYTTEQTSIHPSINIRDSITPGDVQITF